MKQITFLFISLTFMLTFSGCSGDDNGSNNPGGGSSCTLAPPAWIQGSWIFEVPGSVSPTYGWTFTNNEVIFNNTGLQSINYVQLCNSYSNVPTCIFNFSEQSSSNFYEFTWNNCGVSQIIRFEVISTTEIRQFYPLEATLTKQ